MAGITASLAQWDALLQEDYVNGQIVEAINTATPFKDHLKRVGVTSGRERLYPVKVGASQGQGARAEGAGMPPYGAGEYVDATVRAKYNYAPFKVTGQSLEFGTKKAFVEFGLQILKDTKEGLKLFTGRQCWGDGQGTLAMVNGAFNAGIGVATVDSAYGVLWGSFAANTTFLIKRNMSVQFGTEDNGGLGYKVTGVTGTTFTFTPPAVNNIADNALVSILGSANNEIIGALAFTATAAQSTTLGISTTYNGINRTTYPEWEGNVINAAAALSLTNIRAIRDAIYKRTDDEESNLMIGGTEMARDYEALLVPAQRFTTPMELKGGVKINALMHDGLGFVKDSRAPAKAMWFFDTGMIAWMQTKDPHWLQDGNGIMRVVPGQDALEALLKWYSNLDVTEPRRQAVLFNITST
jgi:hypothetical protein